MTVKEALAKADTLLNAPEPSISGNFQGLLLLQKVNALLQAGFALDADLESSWKVLKARG